MPTLKMFVLTLCELNENEIVGALEGSTPCSFPASAAVAHTSVGGVVDGQECKPLWFKDMQRTRRGGLGMSEASKTERSRLTIRRLESPPSDGEELEDHVNPLAAELAAFAAQHLDNSAPSGAPGRQPSWSHTEFAPTIPTGTDSQLSMDLGISKPDFQGRESNFRFGQKDTWEWVTTSGNPRPLHTKRIQTPSLRSHRKALGGSGIKPGSDIEPDSSDFRPASAPRSVLSLEMSQADSAVGSVVSKQEKERKVRMKDQEKYVSMLPGSEDAADLREKAHLKRMLTSADGLAPVRYSFQKLGIDEVNRIVYEEEDATKLINTLSADIHTGLWSCCRKANVQAPGCNRGPHSENRFLCVRCGIIFDAKSRQGGKQECFYHPGALNRSKAGGVWWSCCGAIGFKNSLLHSGKGDIHGAQEWKWGCKKETAHKPLSVMDAEVDPRKFAHCATGRVRWGTRVGMEEPGDMKLLTDQDWVDDDQDVTCMRITAVTAIAQPLLPVILGIQLHFENVIDGEIADGDRRMVSP